MPGTTLCLHRIITDPRESYLEVEPQGKISFTFENERELSVHYYYYVPGAPTVLFRVCTSSIIILGYWGLNPGTWTGASTLIPSPTSSPDNMVLILSHALLEEQ